MTFTLKLVFSGLVTFVPIMDPQNPNHLTAVWVLMVNASDTVPICKVVDNMNPHYHAHQPVMAFMAPDIGDVTKSLESRDIRLKLSGGELPTSTPCFKSSDQGDLRRSHTRATAQETPADACEASDFSWVADMSKFSNFAKVCDHCLDDIVNPGDSLQDVPGDRIRARIKLTQGFLETTALTRNRSQLDYAIFDASSYKQVLAEEVTLTLVNVQDQVTFELCDFLIDPKCSSKELVTLRPSQSNDTITVHFCNEVPCNCGQTGVQMDPENDHFLFFYKLSGDVTLPGNEGTTCDAEVVIPRPRKSDFGDPRCPVNQMLPPL